MNRVKRQIVAPINAFVLVHVLVGVFMEAAAVVESAIPALIPLLSTAAERTDTGSAWCQLMCTSTKNKWHGIVRSLLCWSHLITGSALAVISKKGG